MISLSRIASAFSERPAEILGIKDRGHLKVGNYADLVILDPEQEYSVKSHADLVRNVPEQEYSVKMSPTSAVGHRMKVQHFVVSSIVCSSTANKSSPTAVSSPTPASGQALAFTDL